MSVSLKNSIHELLIVKKENEQIEVSIKNILENYIEKFEELEIGNTYNIPVTISRKCIVNDASFNTKEELNR